MLANLADFVQALVGQARALCQDQVADLWHELDNAGDRLIRQQSERRQVEVPEVIE